MEGPTSKMTNEPPKRVNHQENIKFPKRHNGRLGRFFRLGSFQKIWDLPQVPTFPKQTKSDDSKFFRPKKKKKNYEFIKCFDIRDVNLQISLLQEPNKMNLASCESCEHQLFFSSRNKSIQCDSYTKGFGEKTAPKLSDF